jgi:hypothetical protein
MVSIGNLTYGGKLVLDDLEVKNAISTPTITGSTAVSGSVTSTHKQVGSDDKNLVQIHQKGSIFYLKWSHVKHITSIATTSGSKAIVLTVAEHGLSDGDYFHIQDLGASASDVNGIPFEDIKGMRVAGSITDANEIPTNADSFATSTDTDTSVTPLIRIDRYKYTDMARSNADWSFDTTEPTPPHTNTNTWF